MLGMVQRQILGEGKKLLGKARKEERTGKIPGGHCCDYGQGTGTINMATFRRPEWCPVGISTAWIFRSCSEKWVNTAQTSFRCIYTSGPGP